MPVGVLSELIKALKTAEGNPIRALREQFPQVCARRPGRVRFGLAPVGGATPKHGASSHSPVGLPQVFPAPAYSWQGSSGTVALPAFVAADPLRLAILRKDEQAVDQILSAAAALTRQVMRRPARLCPTVVLAEAVCDGVPRRRTNTWHHQVCRNQTI